MAFRIHLSSKANRFLKRIDEKTYKGILEKIRKLEENPSPSEAKKVLGRKEKVFRLRSGKYRVLYIVYQELSTVVIVHR